MVKTLTFTAEEHARIAAAIRHAEAGTSGEIVAVFAQASDDYTAASSAFALGLTLLAGLLTAAGAAILGIDIPALALAVAQLLGAAALLLALRLSPSLRLRLVPAWLKTARANAAAESRFLALGIHETEARTGVLLFVSEAEHHAEIVADDGIDAKVPQAEWDAIVALLVEAARMDRLADGFVAAIDQSGRLLATHFPAGTTNPNEIPDRLVEL